MPKAPGRRAWRTYAAATASTATRSGTRTGAGGAVYHNRGGGRRLFVHTEVTDEPEGEGYASASSERPQTTLAPLDARSFRRAMCPFVAGWISRHEEYVDLVDQDALDQ